MGGAQGGTGDWLFVGDGDVGEGQSTANTEKCIASQQPGHQQAIQVLRVDSDASLQSEDEHLENASFAANHEFNTIMSDIDGDLAGFENEMPEAMQLSTTALMRQVQQSEQQLVERDVDHSERTKRTSVRNIQSQILDEIAIYPGKFIILFGLMALLVSFGISSMVSQGSKTAARHEGNVFMAPSKQLGFQRVEQPAIDKGALYTLIKRLEHELGDVQNRLELAESRIEVLEEDIMKLKTQRYNNGAESKRKGKANDSMLLGANQKMLYAAALGEGVAKKLHGCRNPSHSALIQHKRSHKR